MEIIDPPIWSCDVRCTGENNRQTGCGAQLRLNKEDLYYSPEMNIMGRTIPEAVSMRCCVCGTWTDIRECDWPDDYVHLQPLNLD